MKTVRFFNVSLVIAVAQATASTVFSAISIDTNAFTYSQNFNSLPVANSGTFAWADNSTLTGWYRRANVSNADNSPDPDLVNYSAQGANVGPFGFYNASTAGGTDRAIGFRINGDPAGLKKGSVGMVFTNNTGLTITGFDLGYTGERWYQTTSPTTLRVQYTIVNSFATDVNGDVDRVQDGLWTTVPALNWAVAAAASNGWTNGTTAAHTNVFSPVTISGISLQDGQQLVIRWNIAETGLNLHGLFIDDVNFGNITAVPEPATVAIWMGLATLAVAAYRRRATK